MLFGSYILIAWALLHYVPWPWGFIVLIALTFSSSGLR